MKVWKNKVDHYYDIKDSLTFYEIISTFDVIEVYQLKNYRDKRINPIIIYEKREGLPTYYYKEEPTERYKIKITNRHPWNSNKIEVGSHSKIIYGDDLGVLKWEAVIEASNMGWEDRQDLLTFLNKE
jgi:hypothetical protein